MRGVVAKHLPKSSSLETLSEHALLSSHACIGDRRWLSGRVAAEDLINGVKRSSSICLCAAALGSIPSGAVSHPKHPWNTLTWQVGSRGRQNGGDQKSPGKVAGSDQYVHLLGSPSTAVCLSMSMDICQQL